MTTLLTALFILTELLKRKRSF